MPGVPIAAPSCEETATLCNTFALVSYLPPPLGPYLNRLRQDLVPVCTYCSHVTILPPRPLRGDIDQAIEDLQEACHSLPPFTLSLGKVEVFPQTKVIYISVEGGRETLINLHEKMNSGPLCYNEPFPFHPHITLAQGFDLSLVDGLRDHAEQYWAAFGGDRVLCVQQLAFVQRMSDDQWIHLAELELNG